MARRRTHGSPATVRSAGGQPTAVRAVLGPSILKGLARQLVRVDSDLETEQYHRRQRLSRRGWGRWNRRLTPPGHGEAAC